MFLYALPSCKVYVHPTYLKVDGTVFYKDNDDRQ